MWRLARIASGRNELEFIAKWVISKAEGHHEVMRVVTVIREMKTQGPNLRSGATGSQEVEETPEKET